MRRRILAASLPFLFAALSMGATACDAEDGAELTDSLTFEDVHFMADPVDPGANSLMFHLRDGAGELLPGASVEVDAQMPMHGHGTVEPSTVVDNGDGAYTASINFQMPGMWEVSIDATQGDEFGGHVMMVKVGKSLRIDGAHFMADPVETGANVLMFNVLDDAGDPLAGAEVTVDPQMPVHGHGSSEVPTIVDNGDGSYTASNVVFQMPGEWEVTIKAMSGGLMGKQKMKVTVK